MGRIRSAYRQIIDEDIFHAECILLKMYSGKLAGYKNKKYVIVSKFKNLDFRLYETRLSSVLKVRAMENFCAVILESDIVNACYQTGFTRAAQVVKAVDGRYGLDTSRMNGPEAIWKDKQGMRKSWRSNFVWLCNECSRLADVTKRVKLLTAKLKEGLV